MAALAHCVKRPFFHIRTEYMMSSFPRNGSFPYHKMEAHSKGQSRIHLSTNLYEIYATFYMGNTKYTLYSHVLLYMYPYVKVFAQT